MNDEDPDVSNGHCHIQLLLRSYGPQRIVHDYFHGTEAADILLEEMLTETSCKWMMFTGGDNMYEEMWIDRVSNAISTSLDAQMIGWKFLDESKELNKINNTKDQHRDISNYLIRSSCFYASSTIYNGSYDSDIRR